MAEGNMQINFNTNSKGNDAKRYKDYITISLVSYASKILHVIKLRRERLMEDYPR